MNHYKNPCVTLLLSCRQGQLRCDSLLACNNPFNPQRCITVLTTVVILSIATLVLLWSASTRQQEYLENQRNLAENSVIGAASQISQKITDLRQSIKLFAQQDAELLKYVAENPNDLEAYDSLVRDVKAEFPSAIAVTIANKNGEPYLEDFDGFILDVCRRDIKEFSANRHPPDIFIHPNPLAYHFDVMAKVNIGLNEQTIFFVSFSPAIISQILNNSELYAHRLLLLKKDSGSLIEITSKGARNLLPADHLRISEDEIQNVIHRYSVTDTDWELVDIPVDDYLSRYQKEIWFNTYAIIALLVMFSGLLLFLLGRAEKKAQLKTESAIRDKVAAEYANRAKSDFLATMSHEIRTPLTSIIGYGETLLRSDQSMEERIDSVNTIISSSEHLLSLINDILDVSKIEAGKLEIEQIKESPFKLLSEVNNIISVQAKQKRLEFSIDYEFPLPQYFYSDYVRMKQILLNLCSNAVKFTEQGQVKIAVRYKPDSDRLYFIVQDSGIGLSTESQKKVFESFTQADSSTSRRYGGTGLGLTLSKQLAALLGGDILLESQSGVGSIFTFYLPTHLGANNRLFHSKDEIPIFNKSSSEYFCVEKLTGNILLAEDNEINQRLIKLNLEKMGARVTAVNNGMEAIAKAQAQDFDLVFMDMQMPVMDGLKAVTALRSAGYSTPIVALTANAMQEDRNSSLNAGCNEFLTKPVHQEQLFAIAKKYLAIDSEPDQLDPLYSSILDEDPDYIDLVNNYIESLEPMKRDLLQAYDEGEWELLRGLIHQVKGTGGGYGYENITKVAAQIEFQIINQNYAEVSCLLQQLLKLFARAIIGHSQRYTKTAIANTKNV